MANITLKGNPIHTNGELPGPDAFPMDLSAVIAASLRWKSAHSASNCR